MQHPEHVQGLWAVIPVKPLSEAKSRLRVSGEERQTIARRSFVHVLGVVCDVVPRQHVLVISRDEEVLALARASGARALREAPGGDLNDALSVAALFAQQRGATGVLSIFSDMPFVGAEDLEAMIAAFDGGNIVIAPNEQGSGSNALLMEPRAIPYRHGEGSFWRHLGAAGEAGRTFTVTARLGLMRDVDTLEDLIGFAGGTEATPRHDLHFHD